jgi:uncharacterized membrane protein
VALLHIIAGFVALLSGAVALCSLKGGSIHRRSGIIFVYAMLAMASSGAVMAALKPVRISVVAGLLTFYLVSTALLTLRRSVEKAKVMMIALTLMAIIASALSFKWAFDATNTAKQALDGYPAPVYIAFGIVALSAAALDVRLLIAGHIDRTHRLARHLWRMCFAMYLATSAFFLGQAHLFPEPLRNVALLSIPVLLVLIALLYWLVRVLFTQKYRRA